MKLYLWDCEPEKYEDDYDYPAIIQLDDGELSAAINSLDGAYVLDMRGTGIHIRGYQNDLKAYFKLRPNVFHMNVCDHYGHMLCENLGELAVNTQVVSILSSDMEVFI